MFEDSPANKVNIAELCAGKKVVIFAVPGAFTPGCSKVSFPKNHASSFQKRKVSNLFCFLSFVKMKTHLPGYLEQSEALKTKGVSEIICISVNDPFVMSAWGKQNEAGGKVRMLADPVAAFTKEIDLAVDLPPLGGLRSKRYSMVVDNGIIKQLNVEPDNTGLSCSLANKLNV